VTSRPEKEHVIPAGFYPPSKAGSRVPRLTIPACSNCNGSWQDDEVHFRLVAVAAGEEPNAVRQEIWTSKVRSSFEQPDGRRRASDVVALMRPVEIGGETRYKIYPAEDPRCLRVARKIVRGLSYHHRLRWPVADREVWADVLRFPIPSELLDELALEHRELDVFQYRYTMETGHPLIESAWHLTFFERLTFIALVVAAGTDPAEVTRQPPS
jgi:hypothetical protein